MKFVFSCFGEMVKKGVLFDVVIYNIFISYFCKVGKFDEVWNIFGVMLSMGVVSDYFICKLII